jgi:hypothetical protein
VTFKNPLKFSVTNFVSYFTDISLEEKSQRNDVNSSKPLAFPVPHTTTSSLNSMTHLADDMTTACSSELRIFVR